MNTPTAANPAVMKIACMDVLVPEVQAQVRLLAAPDFEVRFTGSVDPAELAELVSDAHFLLLGGTRIDAPLLAHCKHVQLIQKFGVGLDAVDMDAVRRAGIPFAVAAGGNAPPVSEMALTLMLAVNRRVLYGDGTTRQGLWVKPEMRSTCLQLDGQTIGLLGFGAIARMTARRLAGFDVKILYHSRTRADADTEQALRARYVTREELLAQSDVLSLHIPLNAETRHTIDARALAQMKPGAIIVNTARGGVIDEAAMVDALRSGRLRGAGLDVFDTEPPPPDNPLFKLDNVVLMPHAGGGAFNNVGRAMGHAIGNMRKFRDGQPLPAADVVVPRAG